MQRKLQEVVQLLQVAVQLTGHWGFHAIDMWPRRRVKASQVLDQQRTIKLQVWESSIGLEVREVE